MIIYVKKYCGSIHIMLRCLFTCRAWLKIVMIIDYRCCFRNPSPISKSAKAYILVHNNYALHLFQCSGAKKIIKGNEQAFNFDLHFKSCR